MHLGWFSGSNGSTSRSHSSRSRPHSPAMPLPVIPDNVGSSSSQELNNGLSRSSSRATLRPPSIVIPPVIPDSGNSPRLSAGRASRLSSHSSSRSRSRSPLAPPSSRDDDRYQQSYNPTFIPSRSRSVTPEIFIPPLEDDVAPVVPDPVPVAEHIAPELRPTSFPVTAWAYPYNQANYIPFMSYPPRPYPSHGMPSPLFSYSSAPWHPALSPPYPFYPQFPTTPVIPQVQYSMPFQASTVHNTPFPSTPYISGPATPWMPTTPFGPTSAPVRINPRLQPGSLRWDLLHPPEEARYVSDYGALKAPKFSDEALTMAPPESGIHMKVTKIQIASSSHPVLAYWMSVWGPIPLPHHKVYDVLSAIHRYLYCPLTPEETKLLLDTPQNVGNAQRAKEKRAKESMALECVILSEEGYRRIDVIGTHRGFGGLSVGNIKGVDSELPEVQGQANGEDSESPVEVELVLGLTSVLAFADENAY